MPRMRGVDSGAGGARGVASMRPGHACPGCAELRDAIGETQPASMRPGHACPGCPHAPATPPAQAPASMRPGHACPGCRAGEPGGIHRRARFNEAGACMPRMRRCLRSASVKNFAGFNEAGACMPRMLMRPSHPKSDTPSASMRPGHACPGCVGGAVTLGAAVTLLQ